VTRAAQQRGPLPFKSSAPESSRPDTITLPRSRASLSSRVSSWVGLAFVLWLVSGCGDDSTAPDSIPPATISDLVALAELDSTASLTWTAPGDDGREGTADRYEVRVSTLSPAIPEWWDEAVVVPGAPRPGPAGVQESFAVRGLVPDSSYTFAIRTIDETGNASSLSNFAVISIVGPRPPAVVDFAFAQITSSWATLSWTHPDPGDASIEAYEMRISPQSLSEENWENANLLDGLPGPFDPGRAREFKWTGLAANQTWFVGLRTRAPGGRYSDIESVQFDTPSLHIQTGSGPLRPVADLSTALTTAVENDIIELGPGRFTGGGNRNLEIDELTVTILATDPGLSILDFEAKGRGWVLRGGRTRFEGLTLTRGRAGEGSNFGGAIFCVGTSSPQFDGCIFEENTAIASGGAVAVFARATPSFTDCTFRENSAVDNGGALFAEGGSNPVFDRCTFSLNQAGQLGGGAYFLSATGQFLRSRFEANEALVSGGAVALDESSPAFDQTIFDGNVAANLDPDDGSGGGAMFARLRSAPTIERSTFARNSTTDWGGAIYCRDSSSPIIEQSVFTGNSATNGGAIFVWTGSNPQIDHCTIVANSAQFGGGVRAIGSDSGFRIRRSILALSTGGAAVHCQDEPDVQLQCSVIFGNRSGDWTSCIEDQLDRDGNFRADPRFCDFTRGDFRLRFDSPCVERKGCGTIGALEAGCTP